MRRIAGAGVGRAAALAAVLVAGSSCSSTTACVANSRGVYVCDTYAGGYPYDYAYSDPLYAAAWGYYPYYVDTYYDPLGYAYVLAMPARPVPIADPQIGSAVPELLGIANRAANAINAGVRAALDPINELMKTPPRPDGDDAVIYGPAAHGASAYQFTIRRLSGLEPRFGWMLEARAGHGTGDFGRVASGLIRVGDQPRRGRGAVGIDCDAMSEADAAVPCRGTLLIGFAHTDDGHKLLNLGLRGYTPDLSISPPIDGNAFAWRDGDSANHVRLVTRTNLSATTTTAPELLALKLTWIKDVGVRADVAATGGDVGPGLVMIVDTCVDATLRTTPACGAGLAAEEPNPDITASDPPAGMPETPDLPATMPDGAGN